MRPKIFCWTILLATAAAIAGCSREETSASGPAGAHGNAAPEAATGPHNGRLFADGDFNLELAIFETGVPPEFHAWPRSKGASVPLNDVDLHVELTRLGDRKEQFKFEPQGEYLRADRRVREPHSFIVKVLATYAGKTSEWSYESLEGRTRIEPPIAEAAGIRTETAGPATLVETLDLYGRVVPDPGYQREVSARYAGLIRSVMHSLGDPVRAGEVLATVESNESLKTYAIAAPISGVVTTRDANVGEQTSGERLFTITNPARVWVELAVFPRDRPKLRLGADVTVRNADGTELGRGKVERVDLATSQNQALTARATLANPDGVLVTGAFVTAKVAVAQRSVPLAVKTMALQPFRDFTVVYEQVGNDYEVRMLELGEQHGDRVEVLGGLEAGARYVTENSYLIKADIEKSGASHDH